MSISEQNYIRCMGCGAEKVTALGSPSQIFDSLVRFAYLHVGRCDDIESQGLNYQTNYISESGTEASQLSLLKGILRGLVGGAQDFDELDAILTLLPYVSVEVVDLQVVVE